MGIQDRDYYRESNRGLGILGERMHACLGLSAVFVIVFFIQIGTNEELGNPQPGAGSITEILQLDTSKIFSGEVWRIFTGPFVHNIGHANNLLSRLLPIGLTLLFLNWFGRHVEDIYGWQEFLGYCLIAAYLGSIGLVVGAALTQHPIVHLGPSGMITAVLLLYALHYPHRTVLLFFFIPTPVWLFAVFYALLDVVGFAGGRVHPAIFFAHLVSAGFALLYYRYSLRVSNWIPSFSAGRSASVCIAASTAFRRDSQTGSAGASGCPRSAQQPTCTGLGRSRARFSR